MQNNKITTRDELKKYFQTGERPTEAQFSEFLDSYTHLNEFNFGISANSSTNAEHKHYHFYVANEYNDHVGHHIIEAPELQDESMAREPMAVGRKKKKRYAEPEEIYGFKHVLSRTVAYKKMEVEISDAIDIEKYQPKIIIERYRQTKKPRHGIVRPKGYLKENNADARNANRKSEYLVTSHNMEIDLEPIHYFRPADKYSDFTPSGSLRRRGSFRMTKCYKPFELARLRLQIRISGNTYLSQPVNFKIVLGSSCPSDPINFIFS